MKLHRMFDIIHTFTFYWKAEKCTFSCTDLSKIQKSIGFLPNYNNPRGTLSYICNLNICFLQHISPNFMFAFV